MNKGDLVTQNRVLRKARENGLNTDKYEIEWETPSVQ